MPMLTDTAASALLAVPPAGRRVAVYFRPGAGRWKRVFTAPDFAGAVARIDGPGSWWLHELPDDADGPGLFDVPDEESPEVAGGAR